MAASRCRRAQTTAPTTTNTVTCHDSTFQRSDVAAADRERAQIRNQGGGQRGREHLPEAMRGDVDEPADQTRRGSSHPAPGSIGTRPGGRRRRPGRPTTGTRSSAAPARHRHRLAPRRDAGTRAAAATRHRPATTPMPASLSQTRPAAARITATPAPGEDPLSGRPNGRPAASSTSKQDQKRRLRHHHAAEGGQGRAQGQDHQGGHADPVADPPAAQVDPGQGEDRGVAGHRQHRRGTKVCGQIHSSGTSRAE